MPEHKVDERAEPSVYVVQTDRGFTHLFSGRQIWALVLLGLIEHDRDGWLLENGKGEHHGPVHHFYRGVVNPPGQTTATGGDDRG